jgi:hypothetical protein
VLDSLHSEVADYACPKSTGCGQEVSIVSEQPGSMSIMGILQQLAWDRRMFARLAHTG